MSSDGRILMLIIVILVGVAVGRHFQRMIDAWRGWKDMAAKLPAMEAGAKAKVRAMVWAGGLALLLLWALANRETFLS
jgi:hypothetical protein